MLTFPVSVQYNQYSPFPRILLLLCKHTKHVLMALINLAHYLLNGVYEVFVMIKLV